MKLRLLLLTVVATALAAPVSAGELQDDLSARRTAIMRQLAPDDILVLWSAPERVYSRDVNYEFRQDSNFYYLTGIDQPESILVLMPGNPSPPGRNERSAILFVPPADPTREHWNGHLLTAAEAT